MSKNSRQTEVSVLDITALTGSFTLISRYLNIACESGLCNMDKASELKSACSDIFKGINTLKILKQFYVNQTNEIKKQKIWSSPVINKLIPLVLISIIWVWVCSTILLR